MRWIATYGFKDGPHRYCRTIWADSINEATKQAERYVNRGYIMLKVVQSE